MAARRESLALTEAYRLQLLTARQSTVRATALAWQQVDLDDLDGTFPKWLAVSAALVEGAKHQVVGASDAYLAAFVASETSGVSRPQGIAADRYLDTEDGRPLLQALSTPLLTAKVAIRAGMAPRALRLGLARATRVVATETMDASRRALGDLMVAEDRVSGFRRATGRGACGACLAQADGHVLQPGERVHRHSHCRCIAEPVVSGVRESVRRPTGREVFDALGPEEQARLFHGRGGAEKADLVRSGAVPFAALAKRQPQATGPAVVTEASLDDLFQIALAATAKA